MLTMGDWQPRNNIWGLDNLFLWMVISFFIGLAILVRKIYLNQSRDTSIILLIFLLLAPLPASLTIDPFHAIRAVIMIVPISIIAALGVRQIFVILKKKYKVIVGLLFIGLLSIEGIFIYERIVVQNALFSYHQWIGGYDQLVEKTLQLDANSYSKIIVDNTDEPATYSLWQVYGEVDPKLKISSNNYYQPEPWKTPESLILKNGTKVEFRNIYWPKDQKDPNILYIGPAARFDLKAVAEAEATVIDKVTDLEGRDMWMMVKSSTKQRE
jgi:hypothetical protein